MTLVNPMKIPLPALGLVLWIALGGCSSTSQGPASAGVAPAPADRAGHTSEPSSKPTTGGRYTEADIAFMKGMIAHHAQAILIAGWAPSHDASPSLKALCERIVVGQKDEIATMQNWLRDRNQDVPSADPQAHMAGMHHAMLMPGMLTDDQLRQLDSARGVEFDRLFLKDMIQHHQGALTMVQQLFGTPGAAQDDMIFKFASDMNADQTIEIERMNKMLAALP
jgi:uncharacterized protein (DUF305 family)